MTINKILGTIVIGAVFILFAGLTALNLYYDMNNPDNEEELFEELDGLLPELIKRFDEVNLDDPETCKEELEQIGYNLTLNLAGSISAVQKIPFQHLWSESAKRLEEVRRQAKSVGFSFSFAALNSCQGQSVLKLDKKGLRESLVGLNERFMGLE